MTRLQALQSQAQALDSEITKLLEDAETPKGSDDPEDEKSVDAVQAFAEFTHSKSRQLGAA